MTSTPPPYCEAYPRLAASEFRGATESGEGRDVCRFATRSGVEVGWLYLTRKLDEGYEAVWKFAAPHLNSDLGLHLIGYRERPRKRGRPSPFRCRVCKRQKSNLYFKTYWACRECQGLRYRSTFLPRNVRLEEWQMDRRAELRGLIGGGRPKGMRQSTYRTLKKELSQLDAASPSFGTYVANAERLLLIEAEWMSEEVAREMDGFVPELVFGEALDNWDKQRRKWK